MSVELTLEDLCRIAEYRELIRLNQFHKYMHKNGLYDDYETWMFARRFGAFVGWVPVTTYNISAMIRELDEQCTD